MEREILDLKNQIVALKIINSASDVVREEVEYYRQFLDTEAER